LARTFSFISFRLAPVFAWLASVLLGYVSRLRALLWLLSDVPSFVPFSYYGRTTIKIQCTFQYDHFWHHCDVV
jgi:hypothetical protein